MLASTVLTLLFAYAPSRAADQSCYTSDPGPTQCTFDVNSGTGYYAAIASEWDVVEYSADGRTATTLASSERGDYPAGNVDFLSTADTVVLKVYGYGAIVGGNSQDGVPETPPLPVPSRSL